MCRRILVGCRLALAGDARPVPGNVPSAPARQWPPAHAVLNKHPYSVFIKDGISCAGDKTCHVIKPLPLCCKSNISLKSYGSNSSTANRRIVDGHVQTSHSRYTAPAAECQTVARTLHCRIVVLVTLIHRAYKICFVFTHCAEMIWMTTCQVMS